MKKTVTSSSLSTRNFPLLIRWGHFTITKSKIPFLLALFLLLIWELQSIAIVSQFTTKYLENSDFIGITILNAVSNFFILGELFTFTGSSGISGFPMFIIFQIYTWTSIGLGLYLLGVLAMNRRALAAALKIWRFISLVHTKCMVFPIFAIDLRIIKHSSDGTLDPAFPGGLLAALAVISIFWNLGFAFMMLIFFQIPIKTKNQLSTKTQFPYLFELIKRCLLWPITIFLAEGPDKIWALLIINVIGMYFRCSFDFKILPYYKLRWMTILAYTEGLSLTLAFLNIFGYILQHRATEIFPKNYILFSWIVLGPVLGRILHNKLRETLINIFIDPSKENPWRLLHPISMFKTFLNNQQSKKESNNFLHRILLHGKSSNTYGKNLARDEEITLDIKSKNQIQEYYRSFLQQAMKRYPGFFQLKLAFIDYTINLKGAYLEGLYLIQQNQTELTSTHEKITFYGLIEEDKKIFASNSDNSGTSKLNMYSYIYTSKSFEDLKLLIQDQARLQKKFWELYTLPNISLSKLYKQGLAIENQKIQISEFWTKNFLKNTTNISQPYLFYGMYYQFLNYRPLKGYVELKNYTWKSSKNKVTDLNELNNDTIYQEDCCKIITSAEKESLGIIKEISANFFEIFKWTPEELKDKNIKAIIPRFIADRHDGVLNRFRENGETKNTIGVTKELVMMNQGFLTPILLHVKFNPHVDQALEFVSLIRPLKTMTNYMIIGKDGSIDSMTKEIAKVLKIEEASQYSNFIEFCPEFGEILDILNTVACNKIVNNEVYDFEEGHKSEKSKLKKKKIELISDIDAFKSEIFEAKSTTRSLITTRRGGTFEKSRLDKRINDDELEEMSMEQIQKIYHLMANTGKDMLVCPKLFDNLQYLCRIKVSTLTIHQDFAHLVIVERMESQTINPSKNNRNMSLKIESKKLDNSLFEEKKEDISMNQAVYSEISLADFKTELEIFEPIPPQKYQFFEKTESEVNTNSNNLSYEQKSESEAPEMKEPRQSNIIHLYSNDSREAIKSDKLPKKREFITTKKTKAQNLEFGENSSKAASSTGSKIVDKLLEHALELPYTKVQYFYFTIGSISLFIAMIALIIAQERYISSSYADIKSKGDIVITAYMRADSMNMIGWGLRNIESANKGQFGINSSLYQPEFLELMPGLMDAMIISDKTLRTQVKTINSDLQQKFYENSILFFDVNPDGVVKRDILINSFEAANEIYNRALNVYYKGTLPIPTIDYDCEFVTKNSLADLLSELENAVSLTISQLLRTIKDFTLVINIMSWTGVSFLIVYILMTLVVFNFLNSSLTGFTNYFGRISEDEAFHSIKIIDYFISGMEQSFETTMDMNIQFFKKKSDKNHKNFSPSEKNLDLKESITKNFIRILKLWPVTLGLIASLIINFAIAKQGITSLDHIQNQVKTIVSYIYLSDVAFVATIDYLLDQGTPTLHNLPIREGIVSIYNDIGNTDMFVGPFRMSDGSIPQQYWNILFNNSCYDPILNITGDYLSLCSVLSGGNDYVGLVAINSALEKIGLEILDDWDATNKTQDDTAEFLWRAYTSLKTANFFQNIVIVYLSMVSNEAFFTEIENQRTKINVIVIAEGIICAVIALVTIFGALIKLKNLDNNLKNIFKIIPLEILLKNRWLKAYLIETAGKLGDSLKKTI